MIRSLVRKYLNFFKRVIWRNYYLKHNSRVIRPTYIHTIGIEGCGHHFWWSYLDKLLYLIAKQNKKIFYNNLHKDNLRKEAQDIYFKWNEFDSKINEEPKNKLFNKLREKVINECNNVIMWNCDSYPTQTFRKPVQNIDFFEIYGNLKDIMDFKYIIITRDFHRSINARLTYNDDSSLKNHTENMIEHLLWIEERKLKINPEDFIIIDFNDIYNSLDRLAEFFNTDLKVCQKLYKRVFREPTRVLPENIKKEITKVATQHIKTRYGSENLNKIKRIINMESFIDPQGQS
jgi:hypothetical protein